MIALVLDLAFAAILLFVAVFDLRTYRIPDAATLAVLVLGITDCARQGMDVLIDGTFAALLSAVLLIATRQIVGRRTQREALGLGDVKFMPAGAFWIGLSGVGPALLIASLSAGMAFLGVFAVERRWNRGRSLPFGPFLALGLAAVRWGTPLETMIANAFASVF